MKSREATKRETREALIRAGAALYTEGRGVEPSLDAICAHAGFTRGAFYVHFKDRTEFLLAIMEDALSSFVDSVIVEEGPASMTETAARFVEAVRRDASEPQSSSLGFLMRTLPRYPELSDRYARVLAATVERLTAVADTGQAAGELRTDVPARDLSTVLVSAAVGLAALVHAGVELDLSHLPTTARRLLVSTG